MTARRTSVELVPEHAERPDPESLVRALKLALGLALPPTRTAPPPPPADADAE